MFSLRSELDSLLRRRVERGLIFLATWKLSESHEILGRAMFSLEVRSSEQWKINRRKKTFIAVVRATLDDQTPFLPYLEST